ncbi:MAG TPA: glycosyltransferase family 39 protein [Aliidongia sp.]|uniref:ArnT family glycosyltransferase n=1 Tax=Aliidongia sp. TaxID=1914230 RepID=UPI002DDC92C0|nr:glycosyltransferase family 39 protein [Aliidongia sp.]HEV2673234.1 glycosyltransferase family 39 protein [Aliidongia sp.]
MRTRKSPSATAPAVAAKPKPAIIPRRELDPNFRIALLLVGAVTFLRLLWLAGQPIDLYPDEAQYWVWAQKFQFGYYSKPPMIAWLIWATTYLFGTTDLAVKISAPLLYVATSLFVHGIAKRLYDARIAGWSTIAFITLPAVSLSALIVSTDVPLLLCWAAATYGFVRAREPDGGRWWILVGVAGGLGLLSKYAMGFWLGSALGFLVLVPDERRHVKPFLLSLLLTVAVYSPNFIWNASNGFVSYLHTRDNANVRDYGLHPGAFAEFAGAQFAVFGPIFLATLIVIAVRARQVGADRRALLLMSFALPTLAIMLVEAMLSRAQPNWSAPTYLTATILVVAYLNQKGRDGLVQWSVVLHVTLCVLLLGARDIASAVGHPLSGKQDPLHRVRGWQTLGTSLSQIRLQHLELPLLADQRELMAALIYYMQPHPFDMRMWNPAGHVKNGFEMDDSLAAAPGGDYLWITQRTGPALDEVFNRFDAHVPVAHVVVPAGGPTRDVTVYKLTGFKGYADPGS